MKVNAMQRKEEYGLLLRNGGAIPLTGVEVNADIIGKTARVQITQEFYNDLSSPIEAIYKFPLPENAALCGFIATVDGRRFTGKIEERNKAYEAYDDSVQAGHGGFLLDEDRPNIFTLSVGNMKPKTSAVISLTYVTVLDVSLGETRFFLPTTISPRYVPRTTPERDGIPADEIVNPPITPSVPYGLTINLAIHDRERISSVDSPSHRIRTEYTEDRILVSFSGEKIAMNKDFILAFTRKAEFLNACYYHRNGADLFFQMDMTLIDCNDATRENGRDIAREIIFLIDCSGSMGGTSIEGAKNALDIFLRALNDKISFNIFRFGTRYESLFDGCVPYTRENIDQARHYLKNMQADLGGTEMYGAFRAIYSDPVPPNCLRSIVFITDGQVGDEEQIVRLVKQNAVSTKVFSVGIGNGPNEYLIKQIARSSSGWHEMISPNERIEPKVLSLFGKVISGPIENIKIDWNQRIDQAPSIPVIFPNMTTTIFGRLHDNYIVPSHVRITGTIDGDERTWKIPFHEVHAAENHLPLFWAKERIREIENKNGRNTKEIIVALSKRYGIISPETSFVAIEERQEQQKSLDKMVRVKVPVMLTKDWGASIHPCMSLDFLSDNVPVFMKKKRASSPVVFDRIKWDTRTDILMEIFSCQRAEGGFSLNAELANKLGTSLEDLKKAAERMQYPKSKEITNKLIEIHSKLAETGFVLSKSGYEECFDRIGRLLAGLDDVINQVSSAIISTDNFTIICTEFVSLYLQEKMSDLRDNWASILQKHNNWLNEQYIKLRPVIDGEDLRSWLKNNFMKSGHI